MASPNASQLHDHALQAEKHLEALSTGLAQANADPGAVKAVAQMAEVMRKLLRSMAKQAQAEPAPAPAQAQPQSMDSATQSMQQDLAARRGQPTQ